MVVGVNGDICVGGSLAKLIIVSKQNDRHRRVANDELSD